MTRKMKDSGIERIGEIPEEWEIVRNKHIFNRKKQLVQNEWNNTQLLSLTTKGIIKKDINNLEGKLPDSFSTYQYVKEGDLILCLFDLDMSAVFNGVSEYDGMISPAYKRFELRDEGSIKYYNYLFDLAFQKREYKNYSTTLRFTLDNQEFDNINTIKPSNDEQLKISNFLDEKINEINNIDEKINQEIEILEEYKKSLITEAVTKGLDPDVEMKDSGIEWIGEIPKHWEIGKTLFYLEMPITDGPHITPTLYDTGIPFVSAEAVSAGNGRINFNNIRGYVSYEFYLECCKKYIPQINDIYMIKSGATTGKVAIVDTDTKFTIRSPLAVFRSKKSKIIPKFLFYVLQSNYYLTQVELFWNYGTQQNIGMRTLENLKICSPKILEQQKIVSYLDEKCKIIDDAIKKKNQQVEILEDYKKSLIYEYVTGKKEVPHA